jgi:hypothetical protein
MDMSQWSKGLSYVLGTFVFLMTISAGPLTHAAPIEYGKNRPGGDYSHFPMTIPEPQLCRAACAGDPMCKAWTFVNPGVQGLFAQCWLKSSVPPAVTDSCCVSGTKAAAPPALEANTDRPGGDYTNVTLPGGSGPNACRALCNADGTCQAWTFVKAGIQATNPRCWLKSSVPPPVPNTCCTSGVK